MKTSYNDGGPANLRQNSSEKGTKRRNICHRHRGSAVCRSSTVNHHWQTTLLRVVGGMGMQLFLLSVALLVIPGLALQLDLLTWPEFTHANQSRPISINGCTPITSQTTDGSSLKTFIEASLDFVIWVITPIMIVLYGLGWRYPNSTLQHWHNEDTKAIILLGPVCGMTRDYYICTLIMPPLIFLYIGLQLVGSAVLIYRWIRSDPAPAPIPPAVARQLSSVG